MKRSLWPTRDSVKDYFPLPKEIFLLGLNAAEIAIYAYLLFCEDRQTFQCWPSYRKIGEAVGLSPNTIRKRVRSLEERGLLVTEPTMVTTKDGCKRNGKAQINPHFLNNTLETIRWMAIRNKQPEIAAQATALARLFKHALNGGQALTTVSEEVTYLRDYVTIQKNRFGNRIDFQFEIDDTVLDCVVMNLILQPLVENAIVHGLEEKLEHGVICIQVFADGSDLCYVVKDNGLGTEAAPIIHALRTNQTSTNVLALTNIQQRLHYRYGMTYGIEFESAPGKGTKVTVRMPQQRREQINETSDRG